MSDLARTQYRVSRYQKGHQRQADIDGRKTMANPILTWMQLSPVVADYSAECKALIVHSMTGLLKSDVDAIKSLPCS